MNISESLTTFSLAAILLTLTPGLDTVLILRTRTAEDSRSAAKVALGISTGCFIWGLAVALGIAALLTVSHFAYQTLKLLGAAYLAWLGLQFIFKPRQTLETTAQKKSKLTNNFLKGVLGNVLNPKVGIFYISFLPQFVPSGYPEAAWILLLVVIHMLLQLIWSSILILAAGKMAVMIKKARFVTWMDRVTGGIFLLFATKLTISSD